LKSARKNCFDGPKSCKVTDCEKTGASEGVKEHHKANCPKHSVKWITQIENRMETQQKRRVHRGFLGDSSILRTLHTFDSRFQEPVISTRAWQPTFKVHGPNNIEILLGYTLSLDKLRPISLTSTLIKVCESFITRWMMQDMEQSLDPTQFGNRRGRSTTHCLVSLVQYIVDAAERGCHTNTLALDFSKALDKVDINIAMQKLLAMNVRSKILPWVADFLSHRQQCLRYNNTTSEWSAITCGVPQGTKVGPVVFLAMVNDVATNTPSRWKYVDDITGGGSQQPGLRHTHAVSCNQPWTASATRPPETT